MQRRKWLAGLTAGTVVIASILFGAACDDDADSVDEVQETAEDGIEDAGETAEDIADDAQDSIGDAVDGDETATPAP